MLDCQRRKIKYINLVNINYTDNCIKLILGSKKNYKGIIQLALKIPEVEKKR